MTGTRTHVPTVGLILAAAISLTSCGSADEPVEPTTPAPTTTEPATTTEAPPPEDDAQTTSAAPELSAAEQDEADIEETLQAYTAALDQAITGEGSIEDIYPYSRDAAREQWVTQVMAYEAQGITARGTTELEVLEISLDGDAAEVKTCVDLSDIEAVDANGDSYISEDRLDQSLNHFVLERDDSAEVGWYVIEDTNRNEPCDG